MKKQLLFLFIIINGFEKIQSMQQKQEIKQNTSEIRNWVPDAYKRDKRLLPIQQEMEAEKYNKEKKIERSNSESSKELKNYELKEYYVEKDNTFYLEQYFQEIPLIHNPKRVFLRKDKEKKINYIKDLKNKIFRIQKMLFNSFRDFPLTFQNNVLDKKNEELPLGEDLLLIVNNFKKTLNKDNDLLKFFDDRLEIKKQKLIQNKINIFLMIEKIIKYIDIKQLIFEDTLLAQWKKDEEQKKGKENLDTLLKNFENIDVRSPSFSVELEKFTMAKKIYDENKKDSIQYINDLENIENSVEIDKLEILIQEIENNRFYEFDDIIYDKIDSTFDILRKLTHHAIFNYNAIKVNKKSPKQIEQNSGFKFNQNKKINHDLQFNQNNNIEKKEKILDDHLSQDIL